MDRRRINTLFNDKSMHMILKNGRALSTINTNPIQLLHSDAMSQNRLMCLRHQLVVLLDNAQDAS